jgi:hypothetical protein
MTDHSLVFAFIPEPRGAGRRQSRPRMGTISAPESNGNECFDDIRTKLLTKRVGRLALFEVGCIDPKSNSRGSPKAWLTYN